MIIVENMERMDQSLLLTSEDVGLTICNVTLERASKKEATWWKPRSDDVTTKAQQIQ